MNDTLSNALQKLSTPGADVRSRADAAEPAVVAPAPVAMIAVDTEISFSPVEDGSLGFAAVTSSAPTESWSIIRQLRDRLHGRRRQLASIVILITTGAIWFSESPHSASPTMTPSDFTDAEIMLRDFETASGASQSLREPAEPVDTNPWGDVASSAPAEEAPSASSDSGPAFFGDSPLTTNSDSSNPTRQAAATAVQTRALDESSKADGTGVRRNARFTGRIQPLN